MTSRRPRGVTRTVIILSVIAVVTWGLTVPTTTRQGVDFSVSTYQIPLYMKALSFIDRHCQYRVLAYGITHRFSSEQDRVLG